MHINTIHKIMEGLSQHRKFFCSKNDFHIAFSSQLQEIAPAYQVSLGVQPNKRVPTIVDIWGQAQDTTIAVELRYPTAEQEAVFGETQDIASLIDYPIETAGSEIRKAVETLMWLSAAKMIHIGFAIVLTNQPKLWNEYSDYDWRDYSSLIHGKNPVFRYFAVEVENCVFSEEI